jgi:hypothetical protein
VSIRTDHRSIDSPSLLIHDHIKKHIIKIDLPWQTIQNPPRKLPGEPAPHRLVPEIPAQEEAIPDPLHRAIPAAKAMMNMAEVLVP